MPWGRVDWELKVGGISWGQEEEHSGPSKVPGAARRCCKEAVDSTGWGAGAIREEPGQSRHDGNSATAMPGSSTRGSSQPGQ